MDLNATIAIYSIFALLIIIFAFNVALNVRDFNFISKYKKDRDKSFIEFLNYTALVDDGIILTEEGTLIAGWYYYGDDVQSYEPSELEFRSCYLNTVLKRLGNEFMISTDAIRTRSIEYPDASLRYFPDPVTRKIDAIRRKNFERGSHFETIYVLIVTYKPARLREQKLKNLMYDTSASEESILQDGFSKNILEFKKTIEFLEEYLHVAFRLQRMTTHYEDKERLIIKNDDVLDYINGCLTGDDVINIKIPRAINISALLSANTFYPGTVPVLGNKYIMAISINGYPLESWPTILNFADKLPYTYRLSHRYIFLDATTAIGMIKSQRRKWQQKERGFKDQLLGTHNGPVNRDAQDMTAESEAAFSEVESGMVAYGLHTCTIIIMGYDVEDLQKNALSLSRSINQAGFSTQIETINTVEAFLGSLPGNSTANIRQVPLSTIVYSDLLPSTSIWPGEKYCSHPNMPPGTPSLLYGSTEGITPFRLNIHIGDISHFLVFGPTGSGKSTLLALLVAQFRSFKNSRIFVFDKDYSIYTLCKAAGGTHYDLASGDASLTFYPLKHIDDNLTFQWAINWLSIMVSLQMGRPTTPGELKELTEALVILKNAKEDMRTLTDLSILIQNDTLRECLRPYTQDGVMGDILDSDIDTFELSDFTVFELEYLTQLDIKFSFPVFMYIFFRLKEQLDGRHPSQIFIDEGWIVFTISYFKQQFLEWLKELRKRFCGVGFFTQSIADAVNSGMLEVIEESCPTKIYLPNSAALNQSSKKHYELLGLNNAEIRLIANATPKREYYIVQDGKGKRLISLDISPFSLAILGQAGKDVKKKVDGFITKYGDQWVEEWERHYEEKIK